jgi:CRISPR-associated protein (TIGR03984 family)
VTVNLVYERRVDLALEDAIAQAHEPAMLSAAVGIVSWPDRCRVVQVDRVPTVSDAHGRRPLSGAFEARFFTAHRELRWRMTPGGGRAVLVSEGEGAGITGWQMSEPIAVDPLAQTYLLFGRADGRVTNGWLRLSEGRMRSFEVPLTEEAQRVVIHVVEYVQEDPLHGNCWVCEERLVGLGPAPLRV